MPRFRVLDTGSTTIRNLTMARFRFFEGGDTTINQVPPAKDDLLPLRPATVDSSGNRLSVFGLAFARDFDPEAFVAPTKVHVAIYPAGTVIDVNDPVKTLNEAPASGTTVFPAETSPFDAEIPVSVGVNTTALFKREPSLVVPYAIVLEYPDAA